MAANSRVKTMADVSVAKCNVCGYVYNPGAYDRQIAVFSPDGDIGYYVQPGPAFSDLPDGWRCPVCGNDWSNFTKVE